MNAAPSRSTDGSVIELDVETRIAMRMSAERREIELIEGRALFDVAHDSSRPFLRERERFAHDCSGHAVPGAARGARVVVTLAEGSVAIDRRCGPSISSFMAGASASRVSSSSIDSATHSAAGTSSIHSS